MYSFFSGVPFSLYTSLNAQALHCSKGLRLPSFPAVHKSFKELDMLQLLSVSSSSPPLEKRSTHPLGAGVLGTPPLGQLVLNFTVPRPVVTLCPKRMWCGLFYQVYWAFLNNPLLSAKQIHQPLGGWRVKKKPPWGQLVLNFTIPKAVVILCPKRILLEPLGNLCLVFCHAAIKLINCILQDCKT